MACLSSFFTASVPTSCIPALLERRNHVSTRSAMVRATTGWSEWSRRGVPSHGFLTFLAAAGFVGALLLTPALEGGPASVHETDSTTLERAVVDRYDHLPLAQILRRTADPTIANRVARAIVKEARQLQLSPSLLAGVLLTENARLEPETVSSRGAVGLMQVMRFHAGVFDCDSDDLLQVEANICHGARVFAGYLKRTNDVRSALLRYNGCVRSRVTVRCRRYPSKVLRQAERIRHQLLMYLPRNAGPAMNTGAGPT